MVGVKFLRMLRSVSCVPRWVEPTQAMNIINFCYCHRRETLCMYAMRVLITDSLHTYFPRLLLHDE